MTLTTSLKISLFLFLIVIILTGYTIYNISSFMPKIEKCEPAFKIIEQCKCVPDKKLADLFKYEDYVDTKVNLSESLGSYK